MKTILVTGGTVFVSKYTAQYFQSCGYEVYVLNRGTKPQVDGVTLIQADRHQLGTALKHTHFDVIIDVTAYDAADIHDLMNALDSFDQYIMISSSAVYPEYEKQPFAETCPLAENKYWGKYGTDKIAAEQTLLERCPNAYIIRPPYLYGPMNNVYREAFVFDCAKADRPFYLPQDGSMQLQFYHVLDLCKFMEKIISEKPNQHVFNVGNSETISIKEWVEKCYACLGKQPHFINVPADIAQRSYFSFYNYEYRLDVRKQNALYRNTISLDIALKECWGWYSEHEHDVKKKPFFEFIDTNLKALH